MKFDFDGNTREHIGLVTLPANNSLVKPTPRQDLYFIPGYPDFSSAPWRSQVFQTLGSYGRVHYFAYQGRYSSSKIGTSVVESLTILEAPNFPRGALIYASTAVSAELLSEQKMHSYAYRILKSETPSWIKIQILSEGL